MDGDNTDMAMTHSGVQNGEILDHLDVVLDSQVYLMPEPHPSYATSIKQEQEGHLPIYNQD